MSPESHTEKTILSDVRIVAVSEHPHLLPQLAQIYYQSWSPQGLCASLEQAQNKINRFDPAQSFAVVDSDGMPFALINSILTAAADIDELVRLFPTYQSVEQASFDRQIISNPTFRICFSVTALPNYRVALPGSTTDLSLSHFLINHFTRPVVVYSRWPAVPMHQHLGAKIVAVIDNSRPEDTQSQGQNVLLQYS